MKNYIRILKVFNDVTELGVTSITEYATKLTEDDDIRQSILQVHVPMILQKLS